MGNRTNRHETGIRGCPEGMAVVLEYEWCCGIMEMTVEQGEVWYMRQVVLYPGEDGRWVAECPSLPGCTSQGRTKEEAIGNVREAIRAYITALEEDHLAVPEDKLDALLLARRPDHSPRSLFRSS